MNKAHETLTAIGLLAGLTAAGCSDKQAGEIMIGISTNMSLPKDVSAIRIQVIAHGEHLHDKVYNVGPGEDREKLPGSLAVVQGEDDTTPVTMKVIALQGPERKARVVAKAISTVPSERIALLSLPIDWLCDGTARSTGDAVDSDYESTCGDGLVCVAGACVSTKIDSSTLGDYEPGKLFGGGTGNGDGTCFDTQPCFAEGVTATLSLADCTFDAPAGSLNVAVRAESDGICGASGCLVPLDQSDSGAGWRESGGKVHLPPKVCELVQSGKALGVAVSTACATKTSSTPTCGPWSSVGDNTTSDECSGDGCITAQCTPGAKQCGGEGGLVPQTCDASGQWQSGEACSDACSDGACSAAQCEPGATQCSGLVVQTCDDGGSWQDTTTCSYICASGACSGSCEPGAKQCGGEGGLVPQTCDASGQWQSGEACSDACSDGACSAAQCEPGATQCSGLVVQTCDDGGSWQDTTTCSDACSDGACECFDLEKVCAGVCVDPQQDPSNCGGCGNVCSLENYCNVGACFDLAVWADWPMPNLGSYDTSTQGVVTDQLTGLMWQRDVDALTYTWANAKVYCADLSLAGYGDWRLPTRIELVSLVDFTQSAPMIDATAFPSTPSEWFWSSSLFAGNPDFAWYVAFSNGNINYYDGVGFAGRVRCVR